MTKTSTFLSLLLGAMYSAFLQRSAAGAPNAIEDLTPQKRPVVIAHRGCFEYGPENSLAAIRACFDLAVDWAEADVRTTKDGILVLLHDETLDRTTNLSGHLHDYTYSQLHKARLRQGAGGKDAPLTRESIPTLADALAVAKGHLVLLLHLKESNYDRIYPAIVNLNAQDRTVFLLEDDVSIARLENAEFVGKVAFIPIVWQCGIRPTPRCYEGDLKQAVDDYRPLHPLGFLPVSVDDVFLKKDQDAPWREHLHLLASADETHSEEESAAGWASLLKCKVDLVLTNRAAELTKYLASVGPQ
jgi:hypothetical protein